MWQLSIICYLTEVVVTFTHFPFLQSDMIKVIAGVMCPCSRSGLFGVEGKFGVTTVAACCWTGCCSAGQTALADSRGTGAGEGKVLPNRAPVPSGFLPTAGTLEQPREGTHRLMCKAGQAAWEGALPRVQRVLLG